MTTPDQDISPACEGRNHDACFHVANPLSKRRDWRGCMCTCHVAKF